MVQLTHETLAHQVHHVLPGFPAFQERHPTLVPQDIPAPPPHPKKMQKTVNQLVLPFGVAATDPGTRWSHLSL